MINIIDMTVPSQRKYSDKIWLQGIGVTPAIKAKELKPGMVTVWNYGETETVENITASKTGKTISVSITCKSGYKGTRKLRANTLVGILC